MQYRRLGRTGLKVSELGFGAWGIGGQMWRGADDRESLRTLHAAADRGVNFFDTALVYGDGHSERLINRFLKERDGQIHVATKVPPANFRWPAQGSLDEVFPRDHILKSAETSLQNLGLERLDLLQLHVWNPAWLGDSQWYETLSSLRRQGKVAYFGVSVNDHQPESAVELVESGKADTVQVIYNIFDQSPEDELFGACQRHDVGVIVRVPFDEGALTGSITPETTFPKKDWRNHYFSGDRKQAVQERVEALRNLLGKEAETLPELALRFCLQPEAVSTVIPGMRSVRHLEANVRAAQRGTLSEALLQQLRRHRWEKNFYS